jgi:glycosyltransferase involved in cell wall biosynthesis
MSTSSELEKSVSFIVPALNEAARIADTVSAIIQAADNVETYEIILIDDGSTDQTVEIMLQLQQQYQVVRTVIHDTNKGMGAAYKSGLESADMNYVMLIPGDNQFEPESIRPVLATIGMKDIVIPYHINADEVRPFFRRLISDSYTALANYVSGFSIPYYNGTVVHRTDLVRSIQIKTDSFAYQLEALVKLLQQGKSFETVGIILKERDSGKSSALRWRNIQQVIVVFFQLWQNKRRQSQIKKYEKASQTNI